MVVDMPYNTYRTNVEALKNARKIISKTRCDAIKLEGGNKVVNIIKHLIKNKISVQGHLGILPQSQKGKFKVKGKTILEKNKILKDAKQLEKAGVFSIVLECIDTVLAKTITQELKIPTIGIGASSYCDGQVLVTDDLIGLNEIKVRFVKKYANISKQINSAIVKFKNEVKKKKFPKKKKSF